jgi:chromatin remodeling complex protein RSC6
MSASNVNEPPKAKTNRKSKTIKNGESKTLPKKDVLILSEESESTTTFEEVSSKRKPRRKVDLESHLFRYQKLITFLDEEIEKKQKAREPGIRSLQNIRKNLKEMENEVPKIAHAKRKNPTSKKVSGFSLKYKISDELAEFMKIEKGSTPTRNEITSAICAYIHIKPGETKEQITKWSSLNPGGKRNLQDPSNKMAILPDAKLKKLLKYDAYVKEVKKGNVYRNTINKETRQKEVVKVTDEALTYSVVQKLIQCQILAAITTPVPLSTSANQEHSEEKSDFEILG